MIAHRKEILQQALDTFRQVLRDPSFSELYADRFAVVIVDEFHHAAASSYRRWLDHLRPQLLLGLSRRQLQDQLAAGFPFLSPGCRLVLDRVASERVLSNLRQYLPTRRPQLLEELRALAAEGVLSAASDLAEWLESLAMDPADFHGIHGASGKARAPPTPPRPQGSAPSTMQREGPVCCCTATRKPSATCASNAGRPGGVTEPLVCLGFATFEGHGGERPPRRSPDQHPRGHRPLA